MGPKACRDQGFKPLAAGILGYSRPWRSHSQKAEVPLRGCFVSVLWGLYKSYKCLIWRRLLRVCLRMKVVVVGFSASNAFRRTGVSFIRSLGLGKLGGLGFRILSLGLAFRAGRGG